MTTEQTTPMAWFVKIAGQPGELHRVFVYLPESGGYLIRNYGFGHLNFAPNKHTQPDAKWEPVQIPALQADIFIDLCRKHISDQEMAYVQQAIRDQHRHELQLMALTYPYVVVPGRYSIPRVWRNENGKWRIYDRKNDKWGKTLRKVDPYRVVGAMDEAGFECWRQTKCEFSKVTVGLTSL